MGGLSINLNFLPHPGGILDQSAKLLAAFDVIRNSLYTKRKQELEAKK